MARNYNTLVKIFTILAKYSEKSHTIDAQHDILYLADYEITKSISEDDMNELKRLGVAEDSEGYLYIYT